MNPTEKHIHHGSRKETPIFNLHETRHRLSNHFPIYIRCMNVVLVFVTVGSSRVVLAAGRVPTFEADIVMLVFAVLVIIARLLEIMVAFPAISP